jgi:polyisoprenoid-binding protein YceI
MSNTTAASQTLTGVYQLDPSHTRLGFVARHAMVTKVRGSFSAFSGTLRLDAEDPSRSSAEVVVEVASVGTGDEGRDAHLRSADFFDVEQYPEMRFTSTAAESLGGDRYRLTGELTIRDVTRPVALELEYTGSALDPFGNRRAGFEGSTEVSRKEWGLTWNAALETGGILVSDKIKLELDVSAVQDPSGS